MNSVKMLKCLNVKMILIVGLGNPGKKYVNTRHNLGFMVIDKLVKENGFSEFKLVKKINAEISKGIINNREVILAKPQTFMNSSGQAVKKLISNLQFPISNLFVVHDDIDLPLGKLRISKDRGSAGHKGVESIIKELGTRDFTRLRLGIQPKTGKPKDVDKFVLKKFSKRDEEIVKKVIREAAEEIVQTINPLI